MEFQVIDADYVLLNNKPVVRLFGKTMEGETVCAFYEDFYSYLYASGEGVEDFVKDDPNVRKVEKVQKKLVMGYQDPKTIYRIETQNPAKTPEIRERLKAAGFGVYEADVLFKYRFMNDLDLNGMGWVKVSDGVSVNTNTVYTRKKLQVKDIKPAKIEGNAPLRFLSLDIECIPTEANRVPEASRDPIIMLSFVFSEPYKGQDSMVLSTRASHNVASFVSEKEMMERFVEIIKEYDPDIITGYNINNFDMPYILERMRQTGVKPVFGRCDQKNVMARKLMSRFKVSISGRVIVDTFEIIKKDYSLARYDLNNVATALLGKKKVDVKHSEIEKLWRGDQKGYEKLVDYSKVDSVLALELLLKLSLLDKYIALAKISGILLQDVLDSGETIRIENFLLREFNKQGYVFPCKPEGSEILKREGSKREELKGGFVIEPIKKLHSSVAVLDFKSMYPSIIRTFNICPTTLMKEMSVENPIVAPSGAKFVPPEVRQGIIPKILGELTEARGATKSQLKKEKDPVKKAVLNAKQWALKIMSNAFYGYLGYSRAKIYDLDLANSVTSFGREIIQKTKKVIEEAYKCEVVYGDTDSVMVKIDEDDLDEISKIAKNITDRITDELPGVLELEFEKVFVRFLPLTKKRYAAWRFDYTPEGWKDSIETKGIETVRRDWCGLVSDTMNNVIEIILKKNDVKGAVKYFNGVVKDLLEGKTDLSKLVITKTMTKMPKNYVAPQPHIELVKKVQMRNPNEAPGLGDRVGYVIVKGIGLLSKRAEDPGYVAERGLQIDSKYYIENQLMPPLERIFGALNISKSELMGNGKQMLLLDALRNGAAPKPLEEIPLESVTGFVCKKCEKYYPRIPLAGMCECGGSVLFSSPLGPAGIAVLKN
jgi:DNA polymerase I